MAFFFFSFSVCVFCCCSLNNNLCADVALLLLYPSFVHHKSLRYELNHLIAIIRLSQLVIGIWRDGAHARTFFCWYEHSHHHTHTWIHSSFICLYLAHSHSHSSFFFHLQRVFSLCVCAALSLIFVFSNFICLNFFLLLLLFNAESTQRERSTDIRTYTHSLGLSIV